MAANTKTKTVDANQAERLALAAQILQSKPSENAGKPITSRVLGFFTANIADTGDSLAELSAAFKAAGRNYHVALQAAEHRQALRTADRVIAYQRQLGQ